jgi:HSP20 family protein
LSVVLSVGFRRRSSEPVDFEEKTPFRNRRLYGTQLEKRVDSSHVGFIILELQGGGKMVLRVHLPSTMTDSFLEDFLTDLSSFPVGSQLFPALDVAEDDNGLVVVAELPGVQKEDLKITVENNILTISGVRRPYEIPQDARIILNEMRVQEFSRSIELPHEVLMDKVSAELENGVLRITLPKTEAARVRTIPIH